MELEVLGGVRPTIAIFRPSNHAEVEAPQSRSWAVPFEHSHWYATFTRHNSFLIQ